MSKNDNSLTLFNNIKSLIEQSRQNAAVVLNAEMTNLYWNIGKIIKSAVLNDSRAEYGKKIVKSLSEKLTIQYGRGWSEKQLRPFLRFAEIYPNEEKVSALWRQLSWTHIKMLIYINEEVKRDFYIEMCKLEHWSTRILQKRIDSMLFERTAISKKSEETIKHDIELLNTKNNYYYNLWIS